VHVPAQIYVGANPAALDLMDRMLAFNPAKVRSFCVVALGAADARTSLPALPDRVAPFRNQRISVEDALKHPYLKKYQSELPKCPTTVDFDFEKTATTKAQLQVRRGLFIS
jgi:hypothetical protein